MREKVKRFFETLSIRYRLLLTFFILLCVMILGITISVNYYNQRFIRNTMEESNEQIMKEVASKLESVYDQINQLYLTLNNQNMYEVFQSDEGATDFQKMQKRLTYEKSVLDLVNANNLQYYINGCMLYAGADNKIYMGNGVMDSGFDVEDTAWFQAFSKEISGKLVYGPLNEDYKPAGSSKKEVLYFIRSWYVPPRSHVVETEEPFILFSVSMSSVTDIFKAYSGETKSFLVEDLSGNSLFSVNMEEDEQGQILATIQNKKDDFTKNGTYFNKQWFITKTTNQKFGWVIYSAESTANVFHDMNRLIQNIYMIIFAAGVIAILLAVYLSRKVVMPITVLNQMISKIEEKDVYLDVRSGDELAQIGERFNQMKHNLQDMTEKIYLSQVQEKEAQLSALQAQINPHFLYNTLDNIYCIAQIEEVDTITSLTENLSKMMRYSMSMKNRYVLLVRELEHVKRYVNILNIRFDNSITLKFLIKDDFSGVEVLKLSLQPLAENAWNHGILPKPGHHGTIQFTLWKEGEECVIQVDDDGIGISPQESQKINKSLEEISYEPAVSNTGSGIALKNVNNRIMLEDGPGYGVRLYPREGGGCKAVVRMKIRKISNEL